jgi:hypothetical protein
MNSKMFSGSKLADDESRQSKHVAITTVKSIYLLYLLCWLQINKLRKLHTFPSETF